MKRRREPIGSRRRVSRLAPVVLGCLLAPSALHAALANRVFVSQRTGNDANNCSNILSPCQSFAGAVVQLNPNGEVIVLDSGGYGPVTITQSVVIEAPPGVLAFIHPPSGDAVTINAGGSDTVVLRGLVLNGGSGNGITVNTVGVLHMENCVVSGFTSNGLNYLAPSSRLFVVDTIVRGNGGAGLLVSSSSGATKASVDRCRLELNGGNGATSSGSTALVSIRDSVASGNTGTGLAGTAGGEINVEDCLVANNGTGVGIASGSGVIRVSDSMVTVNATGISPGSGSILTRTDNTVEGNTSNGAFTGPYSAQ